MEREYVGIDLHRRRSVIVRKNAAGELITKTHIDNSPLALAEAVAAAGPEPEVVLEATFGWYWAVDALEELGARVHLAHPLGNNWGNRRVKNDERDAADLVDLLWLGRLAEAWIAPPDIRELREMVRFRHKLVQLRSGLKAQVHAVMGKAGVLPARVDMWGPGGTAQLDGLELPMGYALCMESLRDLIDIYSREIASLDRRIAERLDGHHGYRAVQALNGVGPVLAAVFVAEIGDVSRFASTRHLCSWAGMTPRHRESDTKVHRGSITKQGSRLVRWAAIEAVQEPRWRHHQRFLPPGGRTAGPPHRAGGGSPQAPHSCLLRLAGRRDPLSRPTRNGRVRPARTQPTASSNIALPLAGG